MAWKYFIPCLYNIPFSYYWFASRRRTAMAQEWMMISLRTQGTLDIYCLLVTLHYRVVLLCVCMRRNCNLFSAGYLIIMGTLHKFRLLLLFVLGKTRNNNITKGPALYIAHTFDVSIYAEPLCGYIHSQPGFYFAFRKVVGTGGKSLNWVKSE